MDFFFSKQARKERFEALPFLEWMRVEVERPIFVDAAKAAIARAENLCPVLVDSLRVAQGAPEHAEGGTLRDHVLRMLTALQAITQGAPIQSIEEFDSHPHISVDLDTILHTAQEQYATLAVFSLLHDVARKDVVRVKQVRKPTKDTGPFEFALKNKTTLGAKEFALYDKLVRAMRARLGDIREEEIMAALYDEYGIQFEAIDHEKWFVNDSSARQYELIFSEYRLTPRDIQHVKFLIRYHIALEDVAHHRGEAALQLLDQGAFAYGIDGSDARDLLLCVLFLNNICGKIHYEGGRLFANTELLVDFVRAEEAGFIDHRKRKHAAREQRARARMKLALEEAGLTLDGLMRDCGVPHTSAREAFAKSVYAYLEGVEGISVHAVLGPYAEAFAEQLALAKDHFDESG